MGIANKEMNKLTPKIINELTPKNIKDLIPTFSLFKGRRFSYHFKRRHGFKPSVKEISLNELILAFKNSPKLEKNRNEIMEFIKAFKILSHKGYGPHEKIHQANFLIQVITRIKHFFSEIKRKKLLIELTQKIPADQIVKNPPDVKQLPLKEVELNPPLIHKAEPLQPYVEVPTELDEPKQPEVSISSFNFLALPEDLQFFILLKLEAKSLLSFYRSSKVTQALIEKRLPNRLKSAKLNEQGFLHWKNVFKDIVNHLKDDPDEFVEMTKSYSVSYSKEIFQEFKKAFKFLHNYENVYQNVHNFHGKGISALIRASEAFSSKYPKTVQKIIEQIINFNLDGKKIKPETDWVILECIEVIATIDFKKAVEIYNSLEFLDPLQQELSTLIIDAGLKGPLQRLIEEGLQEPLELRLLEIVDLIANKQLNKSGLYEILSYNEFRFDEEDLPLIQKILDLVETFDNDNIKKAVIQQVALAYAKMGKFDQCIKMIETMKLDSAPEDISDPQDTLLLIIQSCRKNKNRDPKRVENFLQKIWQLIHQENINKYLKSIKKGINLNDILIEMASVYKTVNQQQAQNILDRVNLHHLDAYSLSKVAKIYISINIEKAKEIANQIPDVEERIHRLSRIAQIYVSRNLERALHVLDDMNLNKLSIAEKIDVLLDIAVFLREGNRNFKAAHQILEDAFKLALQLENPKEQNHCLLFIINEKALINPTEAKQFLEKNNISIKALFFNENIHASFEDIDFRNLAKAYTRLDPNGAEDMIKSQKFWIKMSPKNQAKTLKAIMNAIKSET